jgi:glycosyltransferase involved in cell wall biosynthesis
MKRLLLFNLAMDADHPVLGFTTRWVNELAGYYDAIDVLTMTQGRLAVAPNVTVYSVGKERGASDPQRAFTFYVTLTRLLWRNRYERCFAHMMPLFAVMGAPLLRLRGIPLMVWYTHRQNSRTLQLAEKAAWRVVTAVPSSFPFATPKLRAVGHGIDTDFYTPAENAPSEPPIIVQVARLSPIKHQNTLLEASRNLPAQVILIGDENNAGDDRYVASLRQEAAQPRPFPVQFLGSLSHEKVLPHLQLATVAVNLSPRGLFDKAALESMACGVPTIVSNEAFDEVLGEYRELLCIRDPDDTDGLRQRLTSLLAMSHQQRQHIGHTLRTAVVEQHGLAGLIERLVFSQ